MWMDHLILWHLQNLDVETCPLPSRSKLHVPFGFDVGFTQGKPEGGTPGLECHGARFTYYLRNAMGPNSSTFHMVH